MLDDCMDKRVRSAVRISGDVVHVAAGGAPPLQIGCGRRLPLRDDEVNLGGPEEATKHDDYFCALNASCL